MLGRLKFIGIGLELAFGVLIISFGIVSNSVTKQTTQLQPQIVNTSPNVLVMRDNNISYMAQDGQVNMSYKTDLYILEPLSNPVFSFTYFAPQTFKNVGDIVDVTFTSYICTE